MLYFSIPDLNNYLNNSKISSSLKINFFKYIAIKNIDMKSINQDLTSNPWLSSIKLTLVKEDYIISLQPFLNLLFPKEKNRFNLFNYEIRNANFFLKGQDYIASVFMNNVLSSKNFKFKTIFSAFIQYVSLLSSSLNKYRFLGYYNVQENFSFSLGLNTSTGTLNLLGCFIYFAYYNSILYNDYFCTFLRNRIKGNNEIVAYSRFFYSDFLSLGLEFFSSSKKTTTNIIRMVSSIELLNFLYNYMRNTNLFFSIVFNYKAHTNNSVKICVIFAFVFFILNVFYNIFKKKFELVISFYGQAQMDLPWKFKASDSYKNFFYI
jgi:hypothetical protein